MYGESAWRTTPELVEEIIEVDSSADLTPFITAANSLVNTVASLAQPPLSDNQLELVERWLSAHFYTILDPRSTTERVGGARAGVEVQYQSKVDLNLATSHYGQMAMVLDTSGQLRLLAKGKRVLQLSWLGKRWEAGRVSCRLPDDGTDIIS